MLLLSVLGLTLIVAGLAAEANVSAAVGAFLVGIAISGPAARRGGPAAGRCVARMGTQAAHAHLHGIECF